MFVSIHSRCFFSLIALLLTGVMMAHGEEKSFYRAPQSYSTTRDSDPPKYVRHAHETGIDSLQNAAWLDLGLDYRFRYEYRDDDLRRAQAGLDDPLLHRIRAYLGIHDLLDPFRFAVEMQDSRRYHSHYPRDSRDVNEFAITRLYGELHFKDLLGHDPSGNTRPIFIRYGIHNFEFLDRRLIGNNQWRNTVNAFQGLHSSLGQESNDWQLDLLAVQPLTRRVQDLDKPVERQWLYALIGHWRGWSDLITLEPFYLALHQSAYAGVVERMVHSPGLRGYGKIGRSGFDYDFSVIYQFGQNGARDVRAYGGNIEVGYSFTQPWKPRLSLFYGHASGDRDPNDHQDNRFERFFGFGRPWSANDYIVFENIRTPKARVEIQPHRNLRLDFGYSYYWLASDTDRFTNANNVRDVTGASGSFIGHEFDFRTRFTLGDKAEITFGYAHFTPGGFIESALRRGDTDFAYVEFSTRFF